MDAALREMALRSRPAHTHRDERVRLRATIVEQPSGWRIACEVPGVPREAIEVQLDGRQLVVSAQRSLEAPAGFVRSAGERRGTVGVARFELSENADLEQLTATLRDGVLDVHVGRRAAPTRRVIPVLVPAGAAAGRVEEASAGQVDAVGNEAAQATEDV